MKITHLSYLFSILLFCGPILLLVWKRHARILKRYELAILIAIVISLPVATAEAYALKWHDWAYHKSAVLGIRIGGQIESYVFLIIVVALVGSVTLVLANQVDKNNKGPFKFLYKSKRSKRH